MLDTTEAATRAGPGESFMWEPAGPSWRARFGSCAKRWRHCVSVSRNCLRISVSSFTAPQVQSLRRRTRRWRGLPVNSMLRTWFASIRRASATAAASSCCCKAMVRWCLVSTMRAICHQSSQPTRIPANRCWPVCIATGRHLRYCASSHRSAMPCGFRKRRKCRSRMPQPRSRPIWKKSEAAEPLRAKRSLQRTPPRP